MKVKKRTWIIVNNGGETYRFNYYTVCSVNTNVREELILSQTNGEVFKFNGDAAKSCLEQWEKIVNKEVD